MCAKVDNNFQKGLKFVDKIIHPTRASIHIERTCNTKLAHNYIDRRSWCKLTKQGNLGKIIDPTYFVSDNKTEEMFTRIVIATQMSQAPSASKSQAKTVINVGGFHLAPNMTIIFIVHALYLFRMAN
jgi:hypothetical protein